MPPMPIVSVLGASRMRLVLSPYQTNIVATGFLFRRVSESGQAIHTALGSAKTSPVMDLSDSLTEACM